MVTETNLGEIKKVSHKMRSTLAFVGNDELTKTNVEIESIAKQESDIEKLPSLVHYLDKLYQAVLIQLKKEHAKL
jgi:hypothetical protein